MSAAMQHELKFPSEAAMTGAPEASHSEQTG